MKRTKNDRRDKFSYKHLEISGLFQLKRVRITILNICNVVNGGIVKSCPNSPQRNPIRSITCSIILAAMDRKLISVFQEYGQYFHVAHVGITIWNEKILNAAPNLMIKKCLLNRSKLLSTFFSEYYMKIYVRHFHNTRHNPIQNVKFIRNLYLIFFIHFASIYQLKEVLIVFMNFLFTLSLKVA